LAKIAVPQTLRQSNFILTVTAIRERIVGIRDQLRPHPAAAACLALEAGVAHLLIRLAALPVIVASDGCGVQHADARRFRPGRPRPAAEAVKAARDVRTRD